MKLPGDKRKRTQILLSAAGGGIVLMLGGFYLLLTPMRTSIAAAREKLDLTNDRLKKAYAEIEKMPTNKVVRAELYAEIRDISETHILHPVLGTYILGVREMLDAVAQETAVKVDTVQPTGISDLPNANTDPQLNFFRAFSVQVSGEAGFFALMEFIRRIEERNPYLSLTGLQISVQTTPERHRFSFIVHWPIWTDPAMEPYEEPESDAAGEASDEEAPDDAT